MEGGGAAAMEVLLHTLIDVTKGEISLIRGFKKNADKLPDILTKIQSYLDDAEKKLITEESVKAWLKDLDDVAFDAHNVFDELKYDDISKEMKSVRGEKKKKVLPSCFPSFNHYVRRRHMATRINDIFIRFESVKDEAAKLGLHSRPAIEYSLPEETDPQTLDPVFIGRENDVSNIIHKMLTAKEPLTVLPIVGMGGLGKTTLTRKVFNHAKIKTHFKKQIWVHVSRNFDALVLFKKILAHLTSRSMVDMVDESRVVLVERIQKELKDKTCCIVLDDMWNENATMWESFVKSLSGITSSTKGNFVIVTTRSNEVASIVRTLDIHNLNVLSDDDCLSIIKQKVVSQGEDIPSGFESIAINIAKRCQGLPLAANVAGGLLHRTPKDQWISIAEGWLSNLQVEDNDVSKILRLSFDHLSPPSLKRCFAYCSIFPKGEVIDKQQLIELWMSQGFLQIDPKKSMEVEGNKIFNFLVQNSMLQVVEQDKYANITHCSMHDLMHDLACIVSKGIYQVQFIGSKNDGDEVCYNSKERCRTFRGKVSSDTMFTNFKSLHTLIVLDEKVEELSASINKLVHLRYLDVSPTEISYLPDSIGDLYHLQTLRADNYKMSKLPTTIQYLINLRHLHLPYYTKLPPNIGSLTCLQTLEYYHVDMEEGHRIGELRKLKDLQGKLRISNLEKVRDRKDAESAHLYEKPKIFNLVLEWSMSGEGETNDENVLEGLRPHPNVKVLVIDGFKGTRFPSWTLDITDTLNNLMDVSLRNCSECEEIPMMGQLPHLKYLTLQSLRKVKSIRSSFKVDSSCNKERNVVMFPVLKRLTLSEMPKLVEWMEIEMGENEHPLEIKVFPCLEKLKISGCKELRMDPSDKELNSGLHICGSLIYLKIDGLHESEYLPDWCFLNNQNLSKLSIRNCGKLRELPDGVETLNSLKELDIHGCPNLKSIAYRRDGESQGLTSLESLIIQECEGLRILPCVMLQSCAPSLQTLYLRDLSSLMNLAEIIDCLPKMPLLRALQIWNVPKLISPAPAVFPNLQELWLKPDDRDSSESAKKGVDGMLQAASPHSLTLLTLVGMEDWDSLPHSLQHLNALSTLYLENFRIEELPEWFGNLTSLQTLYLYECEELRSVGIIRSLKKLTELYINDCHPELKRWIGQQTDDVSHIPNIEVDWRPFREDGVWNLDHMYDRLFDSDSTSS